VAGASEKLALLGAVTYPAAVDHEGRPHPNAVRPRQQRRNNFTTIVPSATYNVDPNANGNAATVTFSSTSVVSCA
jgi:hypothetical protein